VTVFCTLVVYGNFAYANANRDFHMEVLVYV